MGQFDNLREVFEFARIHRKQDGKIKLTYEEYLEYLEMWNELSNQNQMNSLKNANTFVVSYIDMK